MSAFRDKIKAYVDDHWMRPCQDGLVWVYYGKIETHFEIAKQRQATKQDWAAVFLNYPDATYGALEGLYLIPSSELGKAKSGKLDVASFPTRKMISSWYDNSAKNTSNPEVLTQKPAYNGLNDCAHFVTQSLGAGGIHVETTGVPTLFNSLHAMSDTKTLAKLVTASAAQNIINSGVMKVGDVIIFSKGHEHHHSVVYMGNSKIAMHTWANHPSHPTLKGDWAASASDDHPLVSLIHFGRDDSPIDPNSDMLGWWQVQWRGTNYYYYFDKHGQVGWTLLAPSVLGHPLYTPRGHGYWFQTPNRTSICWTDTGNLETLAPLPSVGGIQMAGLWNNSETLTATKLSA